MSIHVHPEKGGGPMVAVAGVELVAEKGIAQDKRYFGRRSQNGQPSKRQVTLIEREILGEHARALGVPEFAAGAVRSNIETEGIQLVPLSGRKVQIGTAVLRIGQPRDPCAKMEAIAP
ncbi:MAG TPA: MOSC domain-containing protein, partial [Verrucomicrobiae bacterium]|nr:MOSC domain-containing protein [Verrucomicrobiae bacterium]